MNNFFTILNYIDKLIYEPNGLILSLLEEENQNSKYAGGKFMLSSKEARFRVSKITPKKSGQFVAFWEKDENNNNQPYSYDEFPDLLVITTFKNESEFGLFIFPKKVLLNKNILRSKFTDGKMAMRVYPSWDIPLSKEAIKTQKWQLEYFVDMTKNSEEISNELIKLYCF